jgi:hypothetical protein
MSPRGNGISTTYKTRVATLKACKERMGIVVGQLKDRRELWPADATKSCARNLPHSKEAYVPQPNKSQTKRRF